MIPDKTSKAGRPGLSYDEFVPAWERLLAEGRAKNGLACELLRCSSSTISQFRARYERESLSRELAIVQEVKLPDTLQKAIAEIKLEELTVREKEIKKLAAHLEETTADLKTAEEKAAAAVTRLEKELADFAAARLEFERQQAAAEARIADLEKREAQLQQQYEQLNQRHHQAITQAAVAQKEVELLRQPNRASTSHG